MNRSSILLFGKRRVKTPVELVLDLAGLGYLRSAASFMFYPNDPSRSADNRHYPYIRGQGWDGTGAVISRAAAKRRLNRTTGLIVTDDAGVLGPNGQIEAAATNLVFPSIPPASSGGMWGIGTDGTANAAVAPDGTLTATSYTHNTPGNEIYAAIAATAGDQMTASFWVKGTIGATGVIIYIFDITHAYDVVTSLDYSAQVSATGWNRVSLTFTVPVDCTQIRISYSYQYGAGSNTISLWGAKAAVDPYASTDITTTSGAVARDADAWRCTGLSGLTAEGGLTAMLRLPYASTLPTADQYHLGLNGGNSTDDGIFIWTDASTDHLIAELRSGGASQGTVDLGAYSAATQYAICLGWSAAGLVGAINGVEKTATAAVTVPASIDRIEIGRGISTDTAHGGETPAILLLDKLPTLAERAALSGSTFRSALWSGL